MRQSLIPLALSISLFGACGASDSTQIPPGESIETGEGLTLIEVNSPELGLQSEADVVSVEGTISDAKLLRELRINGELTQVGDDGSFEAEVALKPGLNTIEILADNVDGSVTKDFRSVLQGTFMPLDLNVPDAVVTQLDTDFLESIGSLVRNQIRTTDITAFISDDLIYGDGGCSDSVWLDSANIGDAAVRFTPGNDQISFQATLSNISLGVRVRAARRVLGACVRDTNDGAVRMPSISVSGRIAVSSDPTLGAAVRASHFNVVVPEVNYNISGVNNAIERAVIGNVQPTVEDALDEAMNAALPQMIEEEIQSILSIELEQVLPDLGLAASFVTSEVQVTRDQIILKTGMTIGSKQAAAAGPVIYAPASASSPALIDADPVDLRVGLSLDAINQFISNLWAQQIFDAEFDQSVLAAVGQTTPLGIEVLRATSLLPPRISIQEGELILSAADLGISADLSDGALLRANTITQIKLDVIKNQDNRIRLIKQSQSTQATIAEGQDAGLSEGVLAVVLDLATDFLLNEVNQVLSNVALPSSTALIRRVEVKVGSDRLYLQGDI